MMSVVIRSRNEAHWIDRCLRAVRHQRRPVEDIILVDNASTDDTVAIARQYGAHILHITPEAFTYGRALNLGIAAARFEVVAMLSAHCVPVDELWADYLSVHLGENSDPLICGVYGRQEPLPDSSAMDARDLWTTFREERQVQRKDYFFHNANSAIRKSRWERHPFDEEIHGVEDRAWAKQMLALGNRILYEPSARVYHQHGIHQGRNEGRARRVAQAIRYVREQV